MLAPAPNITEIKHNKPKLNQKGGLALECLTTMNTTEMLRQSAIVNHTSAVALWKAKMKTHDMTANIKAGRKMKSPKLIEWK